MSALHLIALFLAAMVAAPMSSAGKVPAVQTLLGVNYEQDDWTNVPANILERIGQKFDEPNHPVYIIKKLTEKYFKDNSPVPFKVFDSYPPVVTPKMNFDSLLVPLDDPFRSPKHTYYLNNHTLLRSHTTAHLVETMSRGVENFLIPGQVYRPDEIDATHYPIFHQMDGNRLFGKDELKQQDAENFLEADVKKTLDGLVQSLLGPNAEMRWVDVDWSYGSRAFDMEVKFNGQWLEVLVALVTKQAVIDEGGHKGRAGWSFGLGLDRLAMIRYDIDNIEDLWTNNYKSVSPSTN